VDSRERVLTALSGGLPDRLPFALGSFPQPLFGSPDADELFDSDVRFVDFAPPPGQDDFVSYLEGLPPEVHVGHGAQLRTYHEWGYHPERAGAGRFAWLRDAAELARDLLPDLSRRVLDSDAPTKITAHHRAGKAVAAAPPHLGGQLLETAYRLRGFERFMLDVLENEALVEYLLDQLTAMLVENAALLAEAGVDVVLLDDDVASCRGLLLSPAMWRRFFKPRLAKVVRAVRETSPKALVFYHSDGDFTGIVTDLVEVGVDVLNPLQPDCMSAVALRRRLGRARPAFWGTVGSARLWDEGRPEAVSRETRARAATLGPAGLLLAPAYDLDFARRENVEAFVEAARETIGFPPPAV
jgi:uroporphyrinogen decarboxylase